MKAKGNARHIIRRWVSGWRHRLHKGRFRRGSITAVGVLAAIVCSLEPLGTAGAAGSHALITGTGSSWAYNAVNQWVTDASSQGLQVVFTATGSAQGRADFRNKTSDFAVSDIGFQGNSDPNNPGDVSTRGFAYLPIVAGGTAFPYQVKVAGQLVRNLRLSGKTLARIFTNNITSWDDAAITADNNGRALPAIPIIPVIHSEGSGSTAQFTRYLDSVYPELWRPFAGFSGPTEYFPQKGASTAQNGSDGVMNFVSAGGSNGAIGYDEYSYALGKNFPVAKIENTGGFFTLPDQYNVAVALTQAEINMDTASPNYLLQVLEKVYVYQDPRTYPLSSYSYGIIPTDAGDPRMSTAKRQTLVDYLFYSICDGQKEIGPIGYSPLPINLVQASIAQMAKLGPGQPPDHPGADPNVSLSGRDVSSCNNPTFIAGHPEENHLALIAPMPPACDQAGQGPCGGGGPSGQPSSTQPGAASGPGQAGTATGAGPTAGGTGKGSGSTAGGSAGKTQAARGSVGQRTTVSGTAQADAGVDQTGAGPTAGSAPSKTFVADGPPLGRDRSVGTLRLLGVVAFVLLLAVLVAPPVLVLLVGRAKKKEER